MGFIVHVLHANWQAALFGLFSLVVAIIFVC